MLAKLKDLATISSGVTFRARIEASQAGNVRLIQMKDLGADNLVHLASCVRIEHPKPKPSQLAERGDIIFRSRGQAHTAALLNQAAASAIVAAPLFRIRADQARIQPEFLLWWLNQASAQAYFASHACGTMVQMVSKQAGGIRSAITRTQATSPNSRFIPLRHPRAANPGKYSLGRSTPKEFCYR